MPMVRLWWCCVLGLFMQPAPADWLKPGEAVRLNAAEGVVVFGVDSDVSMDRIDLDRIGSPFAFPKLRDLAVGYNLRVLVLPAGDYQFHKAYAGPFLWRLKQMPNSRFRVLAGQLNYVGEVTVRGQWQYRRLSIRNAALQTQQRLAKEFPGLTQRFPWRFASDYPDPYMELLATVRQAAGQQLESTVDLAAADAAPGEPRIDPRLPVANSASRRWARTLFAVPTVYQVQLSPTGHVALQYSQNDAGYHLDAITLATGNKLRLLESPGPINDVAWLDARHLVLTWMDLANMPVSVRIRLSEDGRSGSNERIPGHGLVLSVDPRLNGDVLYRVQTGYIRDPLHLFRVNLLGKLDASLFSRDRQLMRGLKDDFGWAVDHRGELRMVLYRNRGKAAIGWYPDGATEDADMVPIIPVKSDNAYFDPVGFSVDGRLLALSNHRRDQIELVHFDPRTGRIGATLWHKPGIDLRTAVHDRSGAVIGVRYLDQGRVRQHLFERGDERLRRALTRALPGRRLELSEDTVAGNRLVFSEGSADAATWHIYNARTRELRILATGWPALDALTLAGSERLLVKAADGFEIEAFLTSLPADTGVPRPLLVMPHGGPIGVFDLDEFSREAQFFAQLGYAVLRVNFRGSGQAGKDSLEKGLLEYGKGIESDIEAVVDVVLRRADIDAQRVVALGTSYGGYSAMVLALKHPDRYRASVAIAAPTDRFLSFTGGDVTDSEDGPELLAEMLGDPRQHGAALEAISPVFRHREIRRPLLLVHDRGDERVPIEHPLRLRELLRLDRGVELPLIETADQVHGLAHLPTAVKVWPRIAAFLDQALNGEGPWAQELVKR